ncbi:MAG: HNH endonuclease [candidate division Zixibacteria bacterium]|nr:HNH endonuclease [candidate division Zixibacteria bacterium]
MPDRDVQTIKDLIFYQYAKIIVRRSIDLPDGVEAKKKHYGFIKQKFRELKSGTISWSEITREDRQLVDTSKECIYCGNRNEDELSWEHIVPKSLRVKPECETCDIIQGIHNQIWACRRCNSQKGSKGLYEFFKERHPSEKKFYDIIPPLLEKKYLKTIYNCHNCTQTLDKCDINGDGEISVLDIDFIVRKYC